MAGKRTKSRKKGQDVFLKTWIESYAQVSKMWEDSYMKLQKPWMAMAVELFDEAAELPEGATPKEYREFYKSWVKAYQDHFGRLAAKEPGRETLEKLLAGAEESSDIFESWVDELRENSKKTRQVLKGKPDPKKYQECSEAWLESYERIWDELLTLSSIESVRETLEEFTGVPDVYLSSFMQMSKVWRDSYSQLYEPWIDAVSQLTRKAAELAGEEVNPAAYEEFYNLWTDTYKDTYGRYLESMHPTKEAFDTFIQGTDVYLNMYKSWIAALERMAEKTSQISEKATDPDATRDFYTLWIKMYEQAFGSFFEDMPLEGPMKDMMEPVRMIAKINADTFSRMSKMWAKKGYGSAA